MSRAEKVVAVVTLIVGVGMFVASLGLIVYEAKQRTERGR